MAWRCDMTDLGPPEELSNGYLRASGVLGRIGVLVYHTAEGTERRELRLPDEVLSDASLGSFQGAPLTLEHPPVMLDVSNTRHYQVGSVLQPRTDGERLIADVLLTDGAAIAAATSGTHRQLSCGYHIDYDPTPGVTDGSVPGIPAGQRYDGIQRNVRGNHLALVPHARAGPTAALRLDSKDADAAWSAVHSHHAQCDKQGSDSTMASTTTLQTPTEPTSAMTRMRLDGVDYDVPANTLQAVERKLNTQQTTLTEQTARIDELEERLATEKQRADAAEAKLAEATSPAALRHAVHARLLLERTARDILGERTDIADLDDLDVQRAVVAHLFPRSKDKLAKADATYVAARFDSAVELFEESRNRNTMPDALAVRQPPAPVQGRQDSPTDPATARRRMVEHNRSLLKESSQ
jgi:hypothetical protein